ncbi:MAG: zinc-finger domain-containing protein [Holosporales bacterium]|nr:zinc-finger domain-containing protein [Holosporales bacterium]
MKKRPSSPSIVSMSVWTSSMREERAAHHPIVIQGKMVFCQGDGPSGHPRVYLTLEPHGEAICSYCNQIYKNP